MEAPDKITIGQYNIRSNGDVVFSWVEDSEDCEAIQHNIEYLRKDKLWSAEDERILYNVIAYIGYAAGQRGVRDDLFNEANKWLQSLKEKFN